MVKLLLLLFGFFAAVVFTLWIFSPASEDDDPPD